MFFFIIGIIIGLHIAQEYETNIPNVKILVRKASTMLRDAVRGESEDSDRDKNE